MPDDLQPPSQPNDEQPNNDNTPSALFLEMMRQAAARHYPAQEPLNSLHVPQEEVDTVSDDAEDESLKTIPMVKDVQPAPIEDNLAAREVVEDTPEPSIPEPIADDPAPEPELDSSKVISRRPDDWLPPAIAKETSETSTNDAVEEASEAVRRMLDIHS